MSSSATRTPDGTSRLRAAMWGCIVVSLAGVALAVALQRRDVGPRGGAVAVAVTFVMLTLARGTAGRAFDARRPVNPLAAAPPEHDVRIEVAYLRSAVAVMLDWQRKERPYLIASSVVGTIVWGFGDWAAAWMCGLLHR